MVAETLVSPNVTRVATTASFRAVGPDGRDLRALAQPPRQPGGGLLERICPVELFSIVPRRLAGGCALRLPGSDVTEKCSLRDVGAADCAFP